MPVFILPDDLSSLIVDFDLVLNEGHETTSEVTDHPVEQGSNIADHVRETPQGLTLELYVTNTPITDLDGKGIRSSFELAIPKYEAPPAPTPGSVFRMARKAIGAAVDDLFGADQKPPVKAEVLYFPNTFDRVKDTWDKLTTIKTAGSTCTVVTSVKTYTNMVLTRVSLPRTEPGGGTFSLEFKGITTVSTASVTAPKPAEKRGNPKTSKGGQSTTPAKENKASLAAKALAAAKEVFQ